MNPQRWHPRRSESGAALAEFAAVVPLLMLLLLGSIEVGRFIYFGILVSNAAHAGAEYGAFNPKNAGDSTGMQNAATADAPNISLSFPTPPNSYCQCWNGSTATAATCGTECATASYHNTLWVTVTAVGTYNTLFTYPGVPVGTTVTRTANLRVTQ